MISRRPKANPESERWCFPGSHAACQIHFSLPPEIYLFSTNQRLYANIFAQHTCPYMQSPNSIGSQITHVDGKFASFVKTRLRNKTLKCPFYLVRTCRFRLQYAEIDPQYALYCRYPVASLHCASCSIIRTICPLAILCLSYLAFH